MDGTYKQPRVSMDLELGDLCFVVKFGASGLPQLQVLNPASQTFSTASNDGGTPATYGPVKAISIKRNSAGNFTVTIGNGGVPLFRGLQVTWESATGYPKASVPLFVCGAVAATVPIVGATTVNFLITQYDGTVEDPDSGVVGKFYLQFQQSLGG